MTEGAFRHRADVTRGGWRFVTCTACGWRQNCGRPGNAPGRRSVNQAKDHAWTQHLPQCEALRTMLAEGKGEGES